MLVEVLIGTAIAFAIIVGAFFFAFMTPNIKGLSRHDIRGNGDYAESEARGDRGFGIGSDGGGDGGGGE